MPRHRHASVSVLCIESATESVCVCLRLGFFFLHSTMPSTSSISLSTTIQTLSAASSRILPSLLISPTPSNLLHHYLSLTPIITSFWLSHLFLLLHLPLVFLPTPPTSHLPHLPFLHSLLFSIHVIFSSTTFSNPRLHILTILLFLRSLILYHHPLPFLSPPTHPYLRRLLLPLRPLFLASLSASAHIVWYLHASPLRVPDIILVVVFLAALWLRRTAARETEAFQIAHRKWQRMSERERRIWVQRGNKGCLEGAFVQDGLFTWCRYPHLALDLVMWFIVYAFAVAAGAPWLNWTVTGLVVWIAEVAADIEREETWRESLVVGYRDYQRRVSCVLPTPWATVRNVKTTKNE